MEIFLYGDISLWKYFFMEILLYGDTYGGIYFFMHVLKEVKT